MLKVLHQHYDNRGFPLVRFTLGTLPRRLHPVLSRLAGPDGPAALCGGGGVAVLLDQQDRRQVSDLDFFCPPALRHSVYERLSPLAPDHAFSEDLAHGSSRTTLFFRGKENGDFLKAEIEFHADLDPFVPHAVTVAGAACRIHAANPHTLIAKYLSKLLTPGGCPWAPAKLQQRCHDIVALIPLAHGPRRAPMPHLSAPDRENLRQVFGPHMAAVERYLEGGIDG